MPRYGSFLVRWWRDDNGGQRLAVRHIQSDAAARVDAPPDALAWMAAQLAATVRDPSDPPPPAPTPDGRDGGRESGCDQ